MAELDPNASVSQTPDTSKGQRVEAKIDIEKLAEKVYRLMVADLRLAQARGARRSSRRTR